MLVGTNRFCPNCKTVLGITLALPYLEPIGEPFITCPYCGQKFRSGKNYWCDMTPEEKAKYNDALEHGREAHSGVAKLVKAPSS